MCVCWKSVRVCEFGLQVSPFGLASCVAFWAHFRKSFDCFSRFNLPSPASAPLFIIRSSFSTSFSPNDSGACHEI